MLEKIKPVSNPLTIIAIFSGITEVGATSALPFLKGASQGNFVWFLMLFPSFLVCSFFLTLNFNHTVLYAPGDFKDDKSFLSLLNTSNNNKVANFQNDVNAFSGEIK